MNTHDHDTPDAHDETLRWQLRTLHRDVQPARDLWDGIATRISALPQPAIASPAGLRPRRLRGPFALLAVAATLVMALGLGWQLRPGDAVPVPVAAPPASLAAVAEAMGREYEGALREIESTRGVTAVPAALSELDASVDAVRVALARAPDSRFLFDRLQRLYAQRLSLTRRLIAT